MKLDKNEKIYVLTSINILIIVAVSLPFFYLQNFSFLKIPIILINVFFIPYLIIAYIPWRK